MKIKDRLEEWAFDAFPKGNTFRYLLKTDNQVLPRKVRVGIEKVRDTKFTFWFLHSDFY